MTTSNEHNNAPAVLQGAPEINYPALIEAAFAKNRKWTQGTTGCIAFARGAEWFREQATAATPAPAPAPALTCPEACKSPEKCCNFGCQHEAPAPAQGEPFGYFRAEPFGWTDCAKDDEGAIALYERPQEVGLTDADLLNWIERQDLEELSMGLVVDADHDGEYFVNGDDCVTYYGPTLREAIDNAIRARKDNT